MILVKSIDSTSDRKYSHLFSIPLCLFLCAQASISSARAGDDNESEHIEPTAIESGTVDPTVVSYPEYRDPLIGVNRIIFSFNDITYRYFLIPISKVYLKTVPEPVQESVGNFFSNIKSPIFAVNHLLQGETGSAGRDSLRFLINSTLGVFGIFDPAKSWYKLDKNETHFENTLAKYNAGYGFYLVLPLLGPSDARNGVSTIIDYTLNPIPHLTDRPESTIIQAYDGFHKFAPSAENYLILRKRSKDPYIFFRNLHLQGVQRDENY